MAKKKHRPLRLTNVAEYTAWSAMKSRCYGKNQPSYKNYGGRGIVVCDRWRLSFVAFLEDMGSRPSPQHSLDRINNNGNYEPSNCRWATRKEQARNRRNNILVTRNGETLCVTEWLERGSSVMGRFEFQADPSFFHRAETIAKRIGLSLAGYIRYVLTEDMERRERNDIS